MLTRPDIVTATAILAKYCLNPSKGHVDAALRLTKYMKGDNIKFSSRATSTLTKFVQFPLPANTIIGLCDANWGPQDQSKPKYSTPQPELDLFKQAQSLGF